MRSAFGSLWDCFPTGRHYPGIAHLLAGTVRGVQGLADEFDAAVPWRSLPLAVVDFETTGLDPSHDHILEVGVTLFDRGELASRHQWLVRPPIAVSEESQAVHGISNADLADAPAFAEVAPELFEVLRGRLPAAYNAGFDQRFLLAEVNRLGAGPSEPPPACRAGVVWIDPLVWVRELFQYEEGDRKLSSMCEKLGIDTGTSHRAADDATAAGRVLMALADRLPASYGELIRIQRQYEAQQDASLAVWRSRR